MSNEKRPPKKMTNQTSTKNVHQKRNLKELGVVEKTSTKTWYTVYDNGKFLKFVKDLKEV